MLRSTWGKSDVSYFGATTRQRLQAQAEASVDFINATLAHARSAA